MPVQQDPWREAREVRKATLEEIRRLWPVGAAALVVLLAATLLWIRFEHQRRAVGTLPGYQADVAVLEQEYHKFHGKLLRNPEVEQLFRQAAESTAKGGYAPAADLLERASQDAALPIVFNDLGVIYSKLSDRRRAIAAFREALARDAGYRPAQMNLEAFADLLGGAAAPLTSEAEPNNSTASANLITVGTAVEAEISANTDDVDTFRLVSPPAPRDRMAIEITPRSDTLELELSMYDSDQRIIESASRQRVEAGKPLIASLAPPPNTVFYVQVSGVHNSSGPYTITVRALKAFDAFEPDDDIFAAVRITPGTPITANIMDTEDTDYYSFEAPRSGTVTIDVEPHTDLLIPALTTFSTDRRNIGFGPDIRTPGAKLHHTMEVQEHMTYFIQVWSQSKSAGEYTLTVQ